MNSGILKYFEVNMFKKIVVNINQSHVLYIDFILIILCWVKNQYMWYRLKKPGHNQVSVNEPVWMKSH